MDDEENLQLIETAYKYLMDKKSVPLKKLSATARVPFSVIYTFLRGNPAQRIKELEELDVSEQVRKTLKAKIYLMYAQNYTQVTLLSTYKHELAKVQEKSNDSPLPGQPLHYAGSHWKINVVLSTSYVNKVLRPEV